MIIRIENKKDYRGSGEYIGRASLLGNPFKIGLNGNREPEVIEKYRTWLRRMYRQGRDQKKLGLDGFQAAVYDELLRLVELSKQGDLVLICWCHPDRCHGEVIRDAVEGIAKMS